MKTEREQPKKGEYWHVQYGANTKTNIIVKVVSNVLEFNCANWNKDNFKCSRNGEIISIKGELFVEMFAESDEPLSGFL